MPKTTKAPKQVPKRAPARSAESRRMDVIAAAYDLAEEQILAGTASSQVITHFLKEGTRKAELELRKLEEENRLLEAKRETLKSSRNTEELYKQALDAMRVYSGVGGSVEEEEFNE